VQNAKCKIAMGRLDVTFLGGAVGVLSDRRCRLFLIEDRPASAKCKMQSAKWLCRRWTSVGGDAIGVFSDRRWRLVLIEERPASAK
jgi:hypothetical protein